MKTPIQIIDETVEFYSQDPAGRRAQAYHTCVYYDEETGNKCAVGRCCVDSEVESPDFPEDSVNIGGEPNMAVLSRLKPEYQGHPWQLWAALQRLHDCTQCWSDTGLSKHGEALVKNMKNEWS